jgi:hypothetical protein
MKVSWRQPMPEMGCEVKEKKCEEVTSDSRIFSDNSFSSSYNIRALTLKRMKWENMRRN